MQLNFDAPPLMTSQALREQREITPSSLVTAPEASHMLEWQQM